METPSSTTRVTRSQISVALNNNNIPISRKIEDSEKGVSKSRKRNGKQQQQESSALIDITNNSPIVGLAMGSLDTPLSSMAKQRNSHAKNNTPGSGEALLRGQVKTLLQKVGEEAALSKLSLESRPFLHVQGFVNSPMGLLAPTPANTPHVSTLPGEGSVSIYGLASGTPLPVVEEQLISQVLTDIFDEKESLESQKILTRSLLLDFSEKSEISDSSEAGVGDNECSKEQSSPDDDAASIWSIQVNTSTHDEDEEEEEEEVIEKEEEKAYDEENDYEEDGGLVDALCGGLSKISVNEGPKFWGKHKRFVYNSDDEIVGEEESAGGEEDEDSDSPCILRLKGLPTPKGKHMRFPVEEGDN